MAKGILEVTLPELAAGGGPDELNQGLKALILQGHKGRLDASIDGGKPQAWTTRMGEVVDGAEGVRVWFGYSADG